MQYHAGRVRRLVAVLAAVLVASGVTLAGMGVATASGRPSQFAVIKFLPALDEVTLQIPTPPCPHPSKGCVWRLTVNEPLAPGTPFLGQATGTSGLLVVKYPATVCGTVQGDASIALQADVSVGGTVWHFRVGHRITIPCPSTGPTPVNPTVAAVVSVDPAATGSLTAATSVGDPGSNTVSAAAASQLPFTGTDVRSLALLGGSLALAGLLLGAGLDQRRRAARRVQRITDWFFRL
jgi:hypothetical protein